MEVTVLEAANPPVNPVLLIDAGLAKRQVRVEVNRSVQVPRTSVAEGSVQVTLLSKLGTHLLPERGREVTCSIPVRRPNGRATEVKLRVRRCGDEAAVDADPIRHKSMQDALGVTRDYMDSHQLQQRMQALIQDVLRAQPSDPYGYILARLRKEQAEARICVDKPPPAPPPLPPPAGPPFVEVEGFACFVKAAAPPEEAEADEAPPPVLVPRPPATKAPPSASPRKVRGLAHSGSQEAKAAPAALAAGVPSPEELQEAMRKRIEARRAARASIKMVYTGESCAKAVQADFRLKAQRQFAARLTAQVMDRVRKAAQSHDVRAQAHATVRGSIVSVAHRVSPEYRQALTRWTVVLALHSAAHRIGRDKVLRQDCFHEGLEPLPMPIVSIGVEHSSWGDWLGAK